MACILVTVRTDGRTDRKTDRRDRLIDSYQSEIGNYNEIDTLFELCKDWDPHTGPSSGGIRLKCLQCLC